MTRGKKLLASMSLSKLKSGTRTLTVSRPHRVAAGHARLALTLTDGSGNSKTPRRTLRIPSRLT